MSDHILSAIQMLEKLLTIPIIIAEEPTAILPDFEKSYCFHTEYQPMFTTLYLNDLIQKMEPFKLYELRDPLEISTIMFYIQDELVIIGPYATGEWKEMEAAQLLSALGISVTFLNPYKLYHSQFSIQRTDFVLHGASALIDIAYAYNQTIPVRYDYQMITSSSMRGKSDIAVMEKYSYDNVNQHYTTEDELLKAMEEGNEKMALNALTKLSSLPQSHSYLWNQHSGPASLRTMIRIGAKRSGLAPIVIDAICVDYAQKMNRSALTSSKNRSSELVREMVCELCQNIRKYNRSKYSSLIRKTVDYIELNLAQNLAIADCAQELEVSVGYLSKRFKKEINKTFTQYVMERRTEKAAELLRSSKLSIQDISAYVGYLDNNYFVKIFKAHYQMTPSEYRNKYLI